VGGPEGSGGRTLPFTGELWAAPLAGGPSVLVARYLDRDERGVLQTNTLRRQMSADRRRIVLSVGAGTHFRLALIDLDRGTVSVLGPDDGDVIRPALSPDGRRVAFVWKRSSGGDEALWIMNTDGSGSRQLRAGAAGLFTWIYGWTPDSRALAFDQVGSVASYVVLDAESGAVSNAVGFTTLHDGQPADWRSGSPSFVAGLMDRAYDGEYRIVVADRADGSQHVVVRESNHFLIVGVPRWHPTTDEILYRRLIGVGRVEYYVVRASGGEPVRVALAVLPYLADWTPDGNSIVYITGDPGLFALNGTSVHLARRDGFADRELFATSAGGLTDLVTVRYP
jgi:Tol biopolymer transport system component